MAEEKDDRIRRIQQQMNALQEQVENIEEEDILKVPWHPLRGDKTGVALSDGSFIVGLPETVELETDPQARVVLAIFGELLQLRDEVRALRKQVGGARPEMTGSPQLSGEAASFKDGVVASAEKDKVQTEAASQ
jgi:hypothetical protein